MADKNLKTRPTVPRITQLDAVEFDENISSILSTQLLDAEKYLKPGTLSPYKPEIRLLVYYLIFRNSLQKDGASFGQQLLNLKYLNLDKRPANYYFLLGVVLPYLKERYDESWRGDSHWVRKIVDGIWNVSRIIQLANLLIFLREGLYPTVTDRFLKIRHVHSKPPNRGVAYNYMMRELLWHSFMEFIKLTLPLINFKAIQRLGRSWIGRKGRGVQVPPPRPTLDTRCVVCQLRPNTPCRVSIYCEHIACFVCLQGNILADPKFCCPVCGEVSTASEELQYISISSLKD